MNLLQASLAGGAAFREPSQLLSGLTLAVASRAVPGVPYTLADVLAHLAVTGRASLDLASGGRQTWPEGLDVWPDAPATEEDFRRLVDDLTLGLAEAQVLAGDPSSRARDVLTDLAAHNAYHWGQVALLRRLLGDWTGGDGA